MSGLIIVGWLIITAIAACFSVAGLALLVIGPKFNGKFCFESLFPLTVGGLFAWWSIASFPFTVSM